MTEADTRLAKMIAAAFAPSPPRRLGVAVSGGGDSVALLHLLADWARGSVTVLRAVTVDHGLRPEAATEAADVARACLGLGVDHDVLRWTGWDGRGNLPDQARRARYRLMADWAQALDIGDVALGHTADDQAETFLMRLARGSGVDGLAAMLPVRVQDGMCWHRPVLAARRDELRDWLSHRGIAWVDDPTNDDPAYDRVRVRQALAVLAPLRIGVEGMLATAERLRRASDALRHAARDLAYAAVKGEGGGLVIDRARLEAAPQEIRDRLLAQALIWVSGADYRPRYHSLGMIWAAIAEGKRTTLMGCLILPRKAQVFVTREPAAAKAAGEVAVGQVWDGHWLLTGPTGGAKKLTIRALGEAGVRQCPDWRAGGLQRPMVLSSPAIWQGARLIAAPLAGKTEGWRAESIKSDDDFFNSLILH